MAKGTITVCVVFTFATGFYHAFADGIIVEEGEGMICSIFLGVNIFLLFTEEVDGQGVYGYTVCVLVFQGLIFVCCSWRAMGRLVC